MFKIVYQWSNLFNFSSNKEAICSLCEDIIHDLQTYLEDEHTQEEIKEELNKICDIMPRSVRCVLDYVNSYKI